MSFTDPQVDPVQPEGQGEQDPGGDQPYADYLNRVPEDARGDIEPIFRDWNSSVNRRFQEHADYRKTWDTYDQAGVSQYPAETVAWALQVLQNPQDARTWLDQQYGPAESAPQEKPPQEDPYGYQDPALQLEQLLGEKLSPLQKQLEQITQWRDQQEQQTAEAQIADRINSEVSALKGSEEAKSLPPKVLENFESYIEKFAMPYADAGADPRQVVAKAWADLQAFSNEIERGALQRKADAPQPPERGGVADGTPPKISNFKEAEAAALDILRNQNRA